MRKILKTIRNYRDIEFFILLPRIRIISSGNLIVRMIIAFINYLMIILQIFFTKSDIFWITNCPDIIIFPLILRRKKYILDYRSPWVIELTEEFGRGPWFFISKVIEYIVIKNAWIITLTTSTLYEKVKSFRKPIFIIPNYPLKSFGDNVIPKNIFKTKHGCDEKCKIVLFIGRLSYVEGADLLPKTIKEVLKKDENVVFWIVGDGPLFSKLKKIADIFPKKVVFFGWQPYDQIPSFIAAADVCIVPRHAFAYSHLYNEEGVHKISEYMFFEKHIVACGIAESTEYLLVNENDLANGIIKALYGMVSSSKKRTWEDYSEKEIHKMLNLISSRRI
ncbi:MAG: glycosyltransferase [Candidatus Methanomethylicaceae archaeon]